MKFDLTKIDFSKEVSMQLREQHFEIVDNLIKNNETDNNDKRIITLFHGTSIHYLNNILLNGLVTREITKRNNFSEELASHRNLVYLTNKWHYLYAGQTVKNLHNENVINVPCYIECDVPAYKLVPDEDFLHSVYIRNKLKSCLKKKNPILEATYEESLNHYGTIAYLGNIARTDIKTFTILGNYEIFKKNFMDPKSQYCKEVNKWAEGKGKGKLKLMDLFQLEDDPLNLFFYMKDIEEDSIITEVIKKEIGFSLKFNKIKRSENQELI